MDDPRSLEGMARSIDALFSDAEKRLGHAPSSGGEPGPGAVADDPAAATTEETLERVGREVDAAVRSADLLDEVEVIAPRTPDARSGAAPVPIDAHPEEDAEELAAAAAWERAPAEPAPREAEEPPADEVDEPAAEDVDEPPAEAAPAPAEPPRDDVAIRARAMAEAVEAFLSAEPRRREAAADEVRAAAAAHREARELDAPADAVERLAREDDPRSVDLARELAGSAVAARLVARLGMAREDDRRAELFEVAEALGDAVAPVIADALSAAEDRSARRNYLEALVHLGEPGFREAEAMVADARWFVVRNGVAILAEIGGGRAVEHLTSTLGHEHPRVRRETLVGLAHLGGEDAGMLAAGKLEDPEPEVRAAAAMAVGALRVERAQRTLQALLEREEDEDVLVEVLRALGRLGDPGAVPAIEKKAVGSFFSRPATAVRAAAYRALAAIGTPHARRLIEAAADDRDPEVRQLTRSLVRER